MGRQLVGQPIGQHADLQLAESWSNSCCWGTGFSPPHCHCWGGIPTLKVSRELTRCGYTHIYVNTGPNATLAGCWELGAAQNIERAFAHMFWNISPPSQDCSACHFGCLLGTFRSSTMFFLRCGDQNCGFHSSSEHPLSYPLNPKNRDWATVHIKTQICLEAYSLPSKYTNPEGEPLTQSFEQSEPHWALSSELGNYWWYTTLTQFIVLYPDQTVHLPFFSVLCPICSC